VNALLASGIKLKDIAAQILGLSPYALSRHKRNCLAVAQPANGDGESQLDLWIQRADDLYLASGAALDLRGQSAAITAAFRAMDFKWKHDERLQEQNERDNPAHEWNTNNRDEAFIRDLHSIDRLINESEALSKLGDSPLMVLRKKGFAAILEIEKTKPDALPQAVEGLITILGSEPPKYYCAGRLVEN
jgi:hypothetical protein